MRKKIAMLALASVVAAPMAAGLTVNKAQAASLTDVTVALTAETVSTTTGVTLTFTPVTAITTGTILEISYDTAFTGGAGIADADVTVAGTNVTSTVESNFSAGYFRSTLTTTGSVTTAVTVTIDNAPGLTTPATGGNYNWTVSANIGGTGSTFDTGSGLAYVADANDVLVTALVAPVIDMELYQTGSDTLLTDPNTCALGVLSINAVNNCTYDIGYGTNSAAGLTVKVTSDGDLNSGANTINAIADTGVAAGTEEYGFRISDSGTGCGTVTSTYASATDEFAVPTTATNFLANNATCNGTSAGQTAKRAEVRHEASVDTATAVGSYDQLVTYTAFSN